FAEGGTEDTAQLLRETPERRHDLLGDRGILTEGASVRPVQLHHGPLPEDPARLPRQRKLADGGVPADSRNPQDVLGAELLGPKMVVRDRLAAEGLERAVHRVLEALVEDLVDHDLADDGL